MSNILYLENDICQIMQVFFTVSQKGSICVKIDVNILKQNSVLIY